MLIAAAAFELLWPVHITATAITISMVMMMMVMMMMMMAGSYHCHCHYDKHGGDGDDGADGSYHCRCHGGDDQRDHECEKLGIYDATKRR